MCTSPGVFRLLQMNYRSGKLSKPYSISAVGFNNGRLFEWRVLEQANPMRPLHHRLRRSRLIFNLTRKAASGQRGATCGGRAGFSRRWAGWDLKPDVLSEAAAARRASHHHGFEDDDDASPCSRCYWWTKVQRSSLKWCSFVSIHLSNSNEGVLLPYEEAMLKPTTANSKASLLWIDQRTFQKITD